MCGRWEACVTKRQLSNATESLDNWLSDNRRKVAVECDTAMDGVIDSQREKLVVRLDRLSPGEHVLVLRAVDSANNAGLAKVVLR